MKKTITVGLGIFLFLLGSTSCSKKENSLRTDKSANKEDSNPSSFSYTIPKDFLEQELLALMKAKEEGTSRYQKATIQSLEDHYEITISK